MQKIALLLLLSFPVLANSQLNINKTKKEIKNEIEKFKKSTPAYAVTISETDSTLTIIKTDADKSKEETLLAFDRDGRCQSQLHIFNCDHCYKQELEELLGIENYQWKKLNENQYISKFEARLMIELPTENKTNTISIIRTDWSRVIYDIMKGN